MKYLELLTLLQVIRLCIGDSDWIVNGNYEYKILDVASNFEDAKARCEEIYSILSMIKTRDIQEFFESNIIQNLNQNMYLGMERIRNNIINSPSDFIWLDGDNVGSNYENFAFGEPSNDRFQDENCGILLPNNGLWYSDDCKTERSFVCQREVAVEITTTTISMETVTSVKSYPCEDTTASVSEKTDCLLSGPDYFYEMVAVISSVVGVDLLLIVVGVICWKVKVKQLQKIYDNKAKILLDQSKKSRAIDCSEDYVEPNSSHSTLEVPEQNSYEDNTYMNVYPNEGKISGHINYILPQDFNSDSNGLNTNEYLTIEDSTQKSSSLGGFIKTTSKPLENEYLSPVSLQTSSDL